MRLVHRVVIALTGVAVAFGCDRSPTASNPEPAATSLRPSYGMEQDGTNQTKDSETKDGEKGDDKKKGKRERQGLLSCEPLPYDSVTRTIGPAGGILKIGNHELVVPAGALSAVVRITAVAPSDTVNRIEFRPEGLTFDLPAVLTMSYKNCTPRVAWDSKQIAYTTGALVIVEYVPSSEDKPTKHVVGQLSHFSNYAIAW
jgi:hypothetical protein